MQQLTECPVCKSAQISYHSKVSDRHYGIKGEFTLNNCNACKLVFLNPMYNDQELMKFYPEESYYAYHMNFDETKKPAGFIKSILKKIYYFINPERNKKFFKDPGSILDIGCGNGWLLYKLKQKGWNVKGVEPSSVAAKIGNDAGINIFNGILLDTKFNDAEFDVVHSNHSFEHIYNPNEVLDEIYRILKKGGRLFIGIPNYNGINSKIAKKYWYYLGAPVHTYNYSPGNIKLLLQHHNFEVQEINYVSGTAGILGSLQIYLNRKNGKKSDEGSVVNSRVLRFFSRFIAKLENLCRTGDCIEVIAVKR